MLKLMLNIIWNVIRESFSFDTFIKMDWKELVAQGGFLSILVNIMDGDGLTTRFIQMMFAVVGGFILHVLVTLDKKLREKTKYGFIEWIGVGVWRLAEWIYKKLKKRSNN